MLEQSCKLWRWEQIPVGNDAVLGGLKNGLGLGFFKRCENTVTDLLFISMDGYLAGLESEGKKRFDAWGCYLL